MLNLKIYTNTYAKYVDIYLICHEGITMREITIRSMTSHDMKRRNLWMTEVINDNGLVAKAEKKYAYYIAEKKEPMEQNELKNWLDEQSTVHKNKNRHVCIKREFNKETGLGYTNYRTTGSFYIVNDCRIYVVVFLHCVKFHILSAGPFQS